MSAAPEAAGTFQRRAAVMAVGTILSRVTGLGRNVALAYALGLGALTDTYNIANNTPNIVYELVVGGVLSATLIPVFVQYLSGPAGDTQAEDQGWTAISSVVTAAFVVLLVITPLFELFAPQMVRFYGLIGKVDASSDQQRVATTLLRLFVPQILFYGMVTISTALLNARRRFALPMFTPILNNLVVIGVILGFPHVAGSVDLAVVRNDHAALRFLGIGTTMGVVVLALPQVLALRSAGVRLRPVWRPAHPAVKQVLRLSSWTVGFVVANQIALFIVLSLAYGHTGEVAAYQSAQVFFLLPHGVFAVSIMSALQPDLASAWHLHDLPRFRAHVSRGLRAIAVIIVPASAGLIVLARPLVDLVFRHGQTSIGEAHTTAGVLALIAIGLPGFSAYLFLTRVFQAMQDTKTVFVLYVLENGVNVVLALALHPALGAPGLGLAYGLAYVVATAAGLVVLAKRIEGVDGYLVTRTTVRTLVASGLMAAATALAATVIVGGGLVWTAARVLAAVALGGSVYLALARLMRISELTGLLRVPGRRAG